MIATPSNDIVRDIARGGFTGIIVGLVGAGIGSRIVMRLTALLVPGSAGAFTENGNRIGEITLAGSLGLIGFGLFAGVIAATIWVAVSPWIPGAGLLRAVLAMPIAVAFGTVGLIEGDNQDFSVLGHDPVVVGILVALVAVIGFLFALVDDLLDRRLPIATGRAGQLYWVVAIIGEAIFLLVILIFLTDSQPTTALTGVALIGVALATLRTWILRTRGQPRSSSLMTAGRASLAAAVVTGLARAAPEVAGALGMT